jgi:tetratricopeptide (TPR) repeat protein
MFSRPQRVPTRAMRFDKGRIPRMYEESQRFCELGAEHLRREEPEEALQWYERAVREDPQNPDAWRGRGEASYHLGRLERADRYFRRAQRYVELELEGRPRGRGWWGDATGRRFLRLLHWRGLCRFWMGLYEDAARLFRRILKLVPSDPLEVRFLLGETYFRMGNLDRAVIELDRVGDDPDACFNLGLTWFYKADFARSVNAFRRGIFENVRLGARLADVDPPGDVPSSTGTHPNALDGEDAAREYTERCRDLWLGRPLLRGWLRGIYLHPIVQDDLARHLDHIRALANDDLPPGEAARLEGSNAALRNPARLADTDRQVAEDVMRAVFRLEDEP